MIFCFLSGAFLFGVVGVIMAVPVALIVKINLALLYDEPARGRAGKRVTLQARQFCAPRDNVRKATKLSPQLTVFRWGARTATWKPASNTFTAGTSDNSRGWKRWLRH
jgi:hypothetical protein